jgi:CubicO group peptidase (beta-lactamase class C family)
MAENKIYGLSIAVIRDYRIAWARGYGLADTATGAGCDRTNTFPGGIHQQIVECSWVLKLVQDKKADLYADINNYLVSWKFPYDTVSHGKKSHWPIC